MTSAFAYLRISEDPNDKRFGVTRQRADSYAAAADLGAELVALFEDNDVSASKPRGEKTAWAEMLGRIVDEEPDYLIAATLDRLGRMMGDHEKLERLCKSTGTKVVNFRGRNLFDPDDDSWLYESAGAAVEARKTSRRVRRAQAERVKNGKQPNGGVRPYGYEPDRMTQVATEVTTLREMAQRIIQGDSVRSIVTWLNASGRKGVTGKPWSIQTVKQVLHNPRYVGDLAKFNKSSLSYEVIGEAAWEPVFDRETWDRLQGALRLRKGKRGRPPTPSLLGGLVWCGACLRPMYRSRNGYKGSPDTYRCSRTQHGCGHVHRHMEALDRYVVQYVLDHTDPFALERERERLEVELDMAEAEFVEAANHYEQAKDHYAADPTRVWMIPTVNKWNDEKTAARQRREDARHALDAAYQIGAVERWNEGTLEEQRRWIKAHVAGVVCQPTAPRAPFDPATVQVTLVG